MLHSLLHIALLAAATLGIWVLRSRILVAVICILVFPLPAALYYLYAAPDPMTNLVVPVETASDDCVQTAPPAGDAPRSTSDQPTEPQTSPQAACPPARDTSGRQAALAVIAVNYLAVLIGLVAGLLARRSAARPRPAETERRSRPR